jgi:hypothetical protein
MSYRVMEASTQISKENVQGQGIFLLGRKKKAC